MKSTPVKGTRDYLPKEVEIRDYLQNVIAETYRDAGFVRITTPIIEDAINLDKSEGGENLNLIFRVLKRGKKLSSALNNENVTEKELSDMGLRYDLTLPLSRYFSNNKNELMTPFKVIQMDRVYRAERPQKGRLREFMQCDIDIIGNDSRDAEIELILTTTKALNRVGLKNYTVKINDRRILKSIFSYTGFDDADNEKLAIIFDKLDKIGIDGVKAELEENSFDKNAIDKFIGLFENGSLTLDSIADVCDAEYVNDLKYIIDTVDKASNGTIPVEFTPSLVRGQGYYTGTIFEVAADGYSGAVAGGGRYDNLTGVFGMAGVSGVGISFGADRIFDVLNQLDLYPKEAVNGTQLLFINFGEKEAAFSMQVLAQVRAAGIRAEIFPDASKMKKQMGYANSKMIPFVALVGENEMNEGKVTLKNMETGEQKLITPEELVSELS